MLSESGLGLKFSAKAAATAVFLINRSPLSVIEFKIAKELWTSQMPDLNNLKKFGCLVYVHSIEGNLQPRDKRGIFTGYPDGVKGYMILFLENQKMVCCDSHKAIEL